MNEHASSPRWNRGWLLGALLVLATLIVYQPAWNGGPVFDDDDHLTPHELTSLTGLGRIWTEVGVVSQYYPVTHSVFWLQHHLWDHEMVGYHVLNILLHALSALLLVGVLKRLDVPGAWLAGAMFALHPVQVESVAWISELKNTLSTVLYLGAALAYMTFDLTRRRGMYLAALGLFVVALLSKTVTASLPAALLVVFWWKRGALSWRRDAQPLLPFFAIGAMAGLLTAWVERKFIGAEGASFALEPVERVLIAGRAIWFYLGKLSWPSELIFIYPRWEVSQSSGWQYLFPVAALGAVGGLWVLRKRSRGPLAALLFFGGTLFPVLGFLNVYPFIYSFVADHYQYLASLGPIAAASGGIAILLERRGLWARPVGNLLCIGLLATLGILSWRQSRMYKDTVTLWQTTLARNPACFVAHSNLGNFYFERGRVDDAIRHAEQALELKPGFAEIHNNLGNALLAKGRMDEATAQYRKAVELRPDLAVAHFNLGAVAFRGGRRDEAESHFQKAVELRSDYVQARNNLGSILLESGRIDDALVHIEKALAVHPDDTDALNNFGNALLRKSRFDEAIASYRRALVLQPNDAATLNNLGGALLQKGQIDEAISLLEKALQLQPALAQAHSSLGNAFFRKGLTEAAVAHFQKAIEMRPDDVSMRNDLGNALLQQGRFDGAIAQYARALELRPDYDLAQFNFGYALLQEGRIDDAIVRLQKAVSLQPEFGQSRYQLGNAYLQKGMLDDAIVQLRKAVSLLPDFPDALNNLGVALVQSGRDGEAIGQFNRALTAQPDFAEAHNNLGRILTRNGQVPEALTHYRASLKIQPDDPDTLSNLAWVLATWPDASIRSGVQAIVLAQRANQHSGGKDPLVLRTLAAAYAESGRFGEALTTAERALEFVDPQTNAALAGELRGHVELYRAGTPFRETVRADLRQESGGR